MTSRGDASLAFESASTLLDRLRSGQVSSRELVELHLDRVRTLNPVVNAVITVDEQRARAEADLADERRRRGEPLGVLDGLPMTVKDSLRTAGLRTTVGSKALAGYVPKLDCLPVARLRSAGAIVFGKTNMPAFGLDIQTYNPMFGATNNPWDPSRTSGGSSGGSAAAIAAGLSPLEVGGDMGGSIRIPAHYCGVYGHKPSYNLIPDPPTGDEPTGFEAAADINVRGPLARHPDDLDLALDVLAGPADQEAAGWRLALPPARHTRLTDYRVAAWIDDPDYPSDPEVTSALDCAVQRLETAGVCVDRQARPVTDLRAVHRDFLTLLISGLGRAIPHQHLLARLPTALPGDSSLAQVVNAARLTHADWIAVHDRRNEIRRQWDEFFRRYDILLCPVAPRTAPPHDHRYGSAVVLRSATINGVRRPYLDQTVWAGLVGMAYLPSTTAPAGHDSDGLPVGIQIVGPYLEDRSTIDFARRLADVLGGFTAPPNLVRAG